MPQPGDLPEWLKRDLVERMNKWWSSWQAGAPGRVASWEELIEMKFASEREPKEAATSEPAQPVVHDPPYDGSLLRRRYWKKVTET